MICECVDKMIKRIQEKYPKKYHGLKLKNVSFTFPTGETILGIPLSYKEKNPKTGEFYKKDYEISVVASFCPFCGKKLKNIPEKIKGEYHEQ